jgi:hypothetical protein
MPLIKTIATAKKKSGNYSSHIPNRNKSKSNGGKPKSGRVKKSTLNNKQCQSQRRNANLKLRST